MEKFITVLCICLLLTLSCTPEDKFISTSPRPTETTTQPLELRESPQVVRLKEVTQDIKQDAVALETTTTDIRSTATEGQSLTPPNYKPLLDPYWGRIILDTQLQDKIVVDLKTKDEQLAGLTQQLRAKEMEAALASQRAAIANQHQAVQDKQFSQNNSQFGALMDMAKDVISKNEATQSVLETTLQRYMHLLTVAGIICIAISVSLIFTGQRFGMAFGIGSVVVVCLAITVGRFAEYIPIVVVVVGLVSAGSVVWYFFRHKREKAELNRELKTLKLQMVSLQGLSTKEVKPERASLIQTYVTPKTLITPSEEPEDTDIWTVRSCN